MEPVAPQGGQTIGAPTPSDQLTLSPQQQADDIVKRNQEFNVELDKLCKKYFFVVTVVRQDLPNGFVFVPQLMDTKFAPKQPAQPEATPAEAPVEAPAEAKAE